MAPVCFPITFRERESLSLGSQRATEQKNGRKKGRKGQSRAEGWENKKVSRPEIMCSSPCWKRPVLPLQAIRFLLDLTNFDQVSETDSADDEEVEMTGQSENTC